MVKYLHEYVDNAGHKHFTIASYNFSTGIVTLGKDMFEALKW